jgi:hypothetical protein
MKNLIPLFLIFLAGSVSAQEIKTKVQESGFEIKSDPQKEEQFDEANIFIFTDAGYANRTGDIVTGFTYTASQGGTDGTKYPSTDNESPFKDAIVFNLGFRYFMKNNIGYGFRGNFMTQSADFKDLATNPASVSTLILGFFPEVSYRQYLTSNKDIFAFGCLGVGYSYQIQEQSYRFNRITNVNQGFFAVRPSLGLNIPVFDLFHFHAETAYQFSQGKISDGTLSLSQFQVSAGISIRLNPF